MMPIELSETLLPDTSTIAPTSPQNVTRLDLLPRGSELILRTIKRLAMEAEECDSLESILEKIKSINSEVGILLARCEKRRLAGKTE